MAIKFAALLHNTDAKFWLRIQMKYDLWQVKQCPRNLVIPLSQPLLAMAAYREHRLDANKSVCYKNKINCFLLSFAFHFGRWHAHFF